MNTEIEDIFRQANEIMLKKVIKFQEVMKKAESRRRAEKTINKFMYGNEFGKPSDKIRIKLTKLPAMEGKGIVK